MDYHVCDAMLRPITSSIQNNHQTVTTCHRNQSSGLLKASHYDWRLHKSWWWTIWEHKV